MQFSEQIQKLTVNCVNHDILISNNHVLNNNMNTNQPHPHFKHAYQKLMILSLLEEIFEIFLVVFVNKQSSFT